tara:strand:+ start:270 stop:569 length:300 start_codon:yes stop_codon:yes gene_type:complete
MTYPSAKTIADRLNQLHSEEFGGKKLGRYRIDRELFKDISNRDKLERVIIDKVAKALLDEHDLILINLGPFFAILQAKKALAWRNATKKTVHAVVARVP